VPFYRRPSGGGRLLTRSWRAARHSYRVADAARIPPGRRRGGELGRPPEPDGLGLGAPRRKDTREPAGERRRGQPGQDEDGGGDHVVVRLHRQQEARLGVEEVERRGGHPARDEAPSPATDHRGRGDHTGEQDRHPGRAQQRSHRNEQGTDRDDRERAHAPDGDLVGTGGFHPPMGTPHGRDLPGP
jgi:hypothetical protein